jgi:outer membrane protein TolC
MKPRLCILALLCALLSAGTAWAEPPGAFRDTLNLFIQEALKNNPELQEAQYSIRMYKDIPAQAGSLDDPMLEFSIDNVPVNSYSFTQEPMTMKQVGVSQKLPFPGKLGLKTNMAEKDVEIAKENLRDLQLQLVRDLKLSYYELCYIQTAIDITRQNKSLLEQFVKIAQSKYTVGKGIQQDVIKAQVELSKSLEESIRLEELKVKEAARLNTLMNRLPQSSLSVEHGIQQTPFHFTIEDLQKRAVANHPTLKKLQILRQRTLVAKNLAERESYPDVNVGLRYAKREAIQRMENPDLVSGYVSINIPLWYETKQKRKASQELNRAREIEQTLNKTKNRIYLEIKERLEEEARGGERIALIRTGIIPQARQSLESALAAYSVDKVDFLTLLDNQIALFKWQLQEHREITNYEKTLALLEYAVGKPLL